MLGLWAGCSPEKHYKILSFFFDDVPDPNAPKVVKSDGNMSVMGVAMQPGSDGRFYAHKPVADENCNACHTGGPGEGVANLTSAACLNCHEKVLTGHPVMHGPVVNRACLWCHAPHGSQFPGMLRGTAPQICLQCHDRQILTPKVDAHRPGQTQSCLDCHLGHGGEDRRQLRPSATPVTYARDPSEIRQDRAP